VFPLQTIAREIAARLGARAAPLATHVPPLREAGSEQLVASFARKNGLVPPATWIRGADLPSLAFNALRRGPRVAPPHRPARRPGPGGARGGGWGGGALAGRLRGHVPEAGWAARAGSAYGGTRAPGEAARMRCALPPTQQPGGVGPAAP